MSVSEVVSMSIFRRVRDERDAAQAEIERLREALTLIAEGHTAPRNLAQLALWSPHGIGKES